MPPFYYTFIVVIFLQDEYRSFSSAVVPPTSFDCPHSIRPHSTLRRSDGTVCQVAQTP